MDRPVTLTEALAILRAHRPELEARGIRHAALFGSLARGEAGPDSDIDILIDLEPTPRMTIYDYVGKKNIVEDCFPVPVDVVALDWLRPEIRPNVERDAIYAF